MLGFSQEQLPSLYLGIPLFAGNNKAIFWKSIVNKIKSKISNWKYRWLSLSGKIMLVKSVLASIPNYSMSVLKAPAGIIKQIEKTIRNFIWNNNMSDEKKVPLISLKEMIYDKDSGGIGLHDMSKRNITCGAKLVWRMLRNPERKWCKIMQGKYLDSMDSN